MIIRALDDDHDWTFGSGLANFLRDEDAVELNIETRFLSWKGDCFFDVNAGIDWLTRLGEKNQEQLLELDTKRLILTSYGVTGITEFDDNLTPERAYTANYSFSSIFSASYQAQLNQGVQNG